MLRKVWMKVEKEKKLLHNLMIPFWRFHYPFQLHPQALERVFFVNPSYQEQLNCSDFSGIWFNPRLSINTVIFRNYLNRLFSWSPKFQCVPKSLGSVFHLLLFPSLLFPSRMSSFDSDFVIIIPPSSLFLSPQRLSRDKTLIRIIRGETRREKEEERKKRKKERKRKRKRRRSRRDQHDDTTTAGRQQDRRTSTSKHPRVCVWRQDKARHQAWPG